MLDCLPCFFLPPRRQLLELKEKLSKMVSPRQPGKQVQFWRYCCLIGDWISSGVVEPLVVGHHVVQPEVNIFVESVCC